VSTNEIMDTNLRVRRRHKSWPEALKREIVAASLVPGASVSVVARKYDVNTNLVFTWRKRFGTISGPEVPQLVPLVVTSDPPAAAPSAQAYHHTLLFTDNVVLLTGLMLAAGVISWVFAPIKFQADMGLLLSFMFLWNLLVSWYYGRHGLISS
jgi:transposase